MTAPDPKRTLGDAPIQAEYVEQMNQLARFIDQKFNGLARGKARKAGFVLLVFPFGTADGGRCNFIHLNGTEQLGLVLWFDRKKVAEIMADLKKGSAA